MPGKLKSILIWLLVVFVVFALVRNPERSAELVRGAWDAIADGIVAIGRFFSALVS